MRYDDVVLGRRSIRGFKPVPVPKALIREVIELAMRAPSSLNTQPWNFHVVAGAPLDRIREGNTERNLAGVPDSREFRSMAAMRARTASGRSTSPSSCSARWASSGTTRTARQDWVLRGFRQFDAPVSVVVTYDRSIQGGDIAPFDCGAVANALVNAAWSRGLGLRDQQPGHHAVARGARACRDPGRSGHHDLRRHGISGRQLSGERRGVAPQIRRRRDRVRRLRRLSAPVRSEENGPARLLAGPRRRVGRVSRPSEILIVQVCELVLFAAFTEASESAGALPAVI